VRETIEKMECGLQRQELARISLLLKFVGKIGLVNIVFARDDNLKFGAIQCG
jgi:hypothetical protein